MARADSGDAPGELSGAQRSASSRTTAPSVTARLQTSLFYSRPTAVAAPRQPSHPMAMQFLHSFKWTFAVALQAGSARSMPPAAIAGSIAPSGGGGKCHNPKSGGSRAAPAGRAPMTRGQPLSEEDRGHTLTNQRPQLQRSLGILRQAGSGGLQLAHHQDTSRYCRLCDGA